MDVLFIASDDARAMVLNACLREEGYRVERALAVDVLATPDAVVPGLVMLDVTALDPRVVARLRDVFAGPLVVVAAEATDETELAALVHGADDFLRMPLDPRILRARVRRLLRPRVSCVVGGIVVDKTRRRATAGDQRLPLTAIELDVLWTLAQHAGEVVTREKLYREVHKVEYDGRDRGLDIHVSRIRPKLSPHGVTIVSVRGSGYLLSAG